jgi:RES domain-containing protein
MQPKLDLPKRLPLSRVRTGTRWRRIHVRNRNALWFGPAAGGQAVHRFDDTLGRFRVCYLGSSVDVCFAETFLRNPPVRILGLDDLAARSIATIEVRRELRLVSLHGPGLARLGTTADLAISNDYSLSQAWSGALWEHADVPDGLLYRSRHDDSALCIAAYDRGKESLAVVADHSLVDDSILLARLLKRYDLGLTE